MLFPISPGELKQRRKRCASEVKSLLPWPREMVLSCNLCSSRRCAIISARDRYGLPVRTAACLDCGLIYLADRLSANAYARFYSDGVYRDLSARFHGTPPSVQQIQADQKLYARKLTDILAGYAAPCLQGKLLDVGGSAGLVALEFANEFHMSGTVLDPAEQEVAAARAAGLEAIVGSIESWNKPDRYDLILLCRSVEHLYDFRGALTRIRELLNPQGLFYCDIVDFRESCLREGPPEAVTKIDHCYWLTHSRALDLFRSVGFEVVCMNIVCEPGRAGYLLRPCPPTAPAAAEAGIQALLAEIYGIERDWQNRGSQYAGAAQWLRHKAYRVKRRIFRLVE